MQEDKKGKKSFPFHYLAPVVLTAAGTIYFKIKEDDFQKYYGENKIEKYIGENIPHLYRYETWALFYLVAVMIAAARGAYHIYTMPVEQGTARDKAQDAFFKQCEEADIFAEKIQQKLEEIQEIQRTTKINIKSFNVNVKELQKSLASAMVKIGRLRRDEIVGLGEQESLQEIQNTLRRCDKAVNDFLKTYEIKHKAKFNNFYSVKSAIEKLKLNLTALDNTADNAEEIAETLSQVSEFLYHLSAFEKMHDLSDKAAIVKIQDKLDPLNKKYNLLVAAERRREKNLMARERIKKERNSKIESNKTFANKLVGKVEAHKENEALAGEAEGMLLKLNKILRSLSQTTELEEAEAFLSATKEELYCIEQQIGKLIGEEDAHLAKSSALEEIAAIKDKTEVFFAEIGYASSSSEGKSLSPAGIISQLKKIIATATRDNTINSASEKLRAITLSCVALEADLKFLTPENFNTVAPKIQKNKGEIELQIVLAQDFLKSMNAVKTKFLYKSKTPSGEPAEANTNPQSVEEVTPKVSDIKRRRRRAVGIGATTNSKSPFWESKKQSPLSDFNAITEKAIFFSDLVKKNSDHSSTKDEERLYYASLGIMFFFAECIHPCLPKGTLAHESVLRLRHNLANNLGLLNSNSTPQIVAACLAFLNLINKATQGADRVTLFQAPENSVLATLMKSDPLINIPLKKGRI